VHFDFDTNDPKEAYRQLCELLMAHPHIGWESTNEWYDQYGVRLDDHVIDEICESA
jgi:hypothetical protein